MGGELVVAAAATATATGAAATAAAAPAAADELPLAFRLLRAGRRGTRCQHQYVQQ